MQSSEGIQSFLDKRMILGATFSLAHGCIWHTLIYNRLKSIKVLFVAYYVDYYVVSPYNPAQIDLVLVSYASFNICPGISGRFIGKLPILLVHLS